MEYSAKTLDESLWEMLAWWWGRTGIKPDMEEGAVLRTLFEAVGLEVEDLSLRFERGLERNLPQAIFEAFNFPALPALRANTSLTFERGFPYSTPLIIPAGFRVAKADGLEVEVIAEGSILAGATQVTLAAAAVEPGSAANAPTGAYVIPRGTLPTLTRVYNAIPATGGQDQESLDQQKRRFALYIAQLHRGTKAALESTALATLGPSDERALTVTVLDATDRPGVLFPGMVEVYVDDGSASVGAPLLNAIRSALELVRSAGAYVSVYATAPAPLDVSVEVDGPDLEAVRKAALDYVRSLRTGQKVSRENLITALTNASPQNREITLITPSDDVMVPFNARAVIANLSVSN